MKSAYLKTIKPMLATTPRISSRLRDASRSQRRSAADQEVACDRSEQQRNVVVVPVAVEEQRGQCQPRPRAAVATHPEHHRVADERDRQEREQEVEAVEQHAARPYTVAARSATCTRASVSGSGDRRAPRAESGSVSPARRRAARRRSRRPRPGRPPRRRCTRTTTARPTARDPRPGGRRCTGR